MSDMQERKVTTFRTSDGNTVKLEYKESLASTSHLAKEYADAGYPDRYAVFTEVLSSNLSHGMKFFEGEGVKGIFLSVILRPSIFPSQAGLLGPLSTVAFLTALEEHTGKEFGIGWVNDIFYNGVKIGGCSIEGKLDNFTSYEYLIVNFSVKLDEKNFPPRLTDMMRQVFEEDNYSIGMIIAKTVLNKFFLLYKDLKNPAKHMEAYKNKFILKGKKIKYISDGKKKTATVSGIDTATCALRLEIKDSQSIVINSPSGVIIPSKI